VLSLPELQKQLTETLYGGEPPEELLRRVLANGLDPARRLQVYRNNTFSNLTGALRAVYPVIDRLVGEAFFDEAARQYIPKQPSLSGNLHDFGATFAAFLGDYAHAQSLPYLADVARLEWAYHRAFHAVDHAPLDLQALSQVSRDKLDRLVFFLHPSATLIHSRWPIITIWQANRDETGNEPGEISLDSGACMALVIRRGMDVFFESPPGPEFTLLQKIAAGENLGAATRAALAAGAIDLEDVLQRHVTCKTVTSFTVL
jgi:hypothetical protein